MYKSVTIHSFLFFNIYGIVPQEGGWAIALQYFMGENLWYTQITA